MYLRYLQRAGIASASLLMYLILGLGHSDPTGAQVPQKLNYQGYLVTPITGVPVDATVPMVFKLYNVANSGSALYTENQNILVSKGLFSAVIGAVTPLTLPFDRQYYLGIAANGDAEMTPRQALSASPYAFTSLYTTYKNMLVVTASGGQYNSITNALNAITDNSATNRYLIFIAPGVYTETVTMKPYVDIQGSGEGTTRITQVTAATNTTGTVIGASNAELRFLTVESAGGSGVYAIAIYNNAASPRITHVTVTVKDVGIDMDGVYNYNTSSPTMTNVTVNATISPTASNVRGVHNNTNSSPTMNNVTVTTTSTNLGNPTGIFNEAGSSPTMNNVTVVATGGSSATGISNNASAPVLTNSTVTAGSLGIANVASSMIIRNSAISAGVGISNQALSGAYTVTITNSQISGGPTIATSGFFATRVAATQLSGAAISGGPVVCAGVYDEAFVFFASTCP